jgi:hypothetical protein
MYRIATSARHADRLRSDSGRRVVMHKVVEEQLTKRE